MNTNEIKNDSDKLSDLFTDEFLQIHTNCQSYEEFISHPIFEHDLSMGDIDVDLVNEFVQSISEFENFYELLMQAKIDCSIKNMKSFSKP